MGRRESQNRGWVHIRRPWAGEGSSIGAAWSNAPNICMAMSNGGSTTAPLQSQQLGSARVCTLQPIRPPVALPPLSITSIKKRAPSIILTFVGRERQLGSSNQQLNELLTSSAAHNHRRAARPWRARPRPNLTTNYLHLYSVNLILLHLTSSSYM